MKRIAGRRYYSDRGLLAISQLENFKQYLDKIGINYREGKGIYQVLQVNYGGGWSPIYIRQEAKEHLTVQRELVPLVQKFQKSCENN